MSAPPAQAGNSSAVLPQKSGAEAAHVLLAVNPKAGSGRFVHLLESLQEKLAEAGFAVQRCTDVATLQSQAKALAEQGKLRVVIVAGGDGSARLIAESLPANTPLMILPLGTENLLARHLGYSRDAEAMVEIVKNGQPTAMDAGLANGKLFLVMVGIGFDASVVKALHDHRSGNITRWSYVWPIISAVWRYRYPKMELRWQTPTRCETDPAVQLLSLNAAFVFVSNLPRYAGFLTFAPKAVGTDGLLDVVAFLKGSFWRGVLYVVSVWLGLHQRLGNVKIAPTQKLHISSTADYPVYFQIDGDPGGELPLEIEVLPGHLTFLRSPR